MTWLDEYEKQMKFLGLTREKRMARVLREQNEYIKEVTKIAEDAIGGLMNLTEGLNNFLVNGVRRNLLDIKHNLSKEARELTGWNDEAE